jgi:hypothetical protein
MKKQKSYLMTKYDRSSYDYPGQHEEIRLKHKIRMKRNKLRKKRKKRN